MGFFDRFKKNKNANKKVKRVERKRKAIDKQPDIEESQLALREIAVNSKNRHERAQATDSITNQYVALDIAKHVTDRAIRLIAAILQSAISFLVFISSISKSYLDSISSTSSR